MEHPDSGQLVAFLDGEVSESEAGEIKAHLDQCPDCSASFLALESSSSAVSDALSRLDTAPPSNQLKARRRPTQDNASKVRTGFWTLPRAASIALLFTAGGASALPGSPVRQWMTQLLDNVMVGSGTDTQADPTTPDTEPQAGGDQAEMGPGAGVAAVDGNVEIWIHDLPAEAELRVQWIDGDDAWVFAGEGTRFNTAAGRVEAFSPPGSVRVEIPRNLPGVVVYLNGGTLLRKSGGEVEILGPVHERTPSEILFGPSGVSNDQPL